MGGRQGQRARPGSLCEGGASPHAPACKGAVSPRPGASLTLAVDLLLLNVKPAFSGHCVILFTARLWGVLDQ